MHARKERRNPNFPDKMVSSEQVTTSGKKKKILGVIIYSFVKVSA